MTIWFTSDLHLDHRYVLDMRGITNEHIIDTINQYVNPDDTLYIVGDFALATRRRMKELRSMINAGTVHLIAGNHDNEKNAAQVFDSVTLAAKIGSFRRDGASIIASHCPYAEWDKMDKGRIHVHGHIHSVPAKKNRLLQTLPQMPERVHGLNGYNELQRRLGVHRMDVGWDAWGKPISFEKIVDWFGWNRFTCLD